MELSALFYHSNKVQQALNDNKITSESHCLYSIKYKNWLEDYPICSDELIFARERSSEPFKRSSIDFKHSSECLLFSSKEGNYSSNPRIVGLMIF